MTDNDITVALIAGLDTDGPGVGFTADERREALDVLRTGIERLPRVTRREAGERVLPLLGRSLKKPVIELLVEAWRQRGELQDAAKRGEDGGEVEGKVHLIAHTVAWAARPSVQVELNGNSVGSIGFSVEASLKLDGVQLVMQNGRITRIEAGTLTADVKLKCEGVPLVPPRTKKINLPVELRLPPEGLDLGLPS